MLDSDGYIKLVDFGLSKLLRKERDFLTSTICGTCSYMAPEQLFGQGYSF